MYSHNLAIVCLVLSCLRVDTLLLVKLNAFVVEYFTACFFKRQFTSTLLVRSNNNSYQPYLCCFVTSSLTLNLSLVFFIHCDTILLQVLALVYCMFLHCFTFFFCAILWFYGISSKHCFINANLALPLDCLFFLVLTTYTYFFRIALQYNGACLAHPRPTTPIAVYFYRLPNEIIRRKSSHGV